MIVVKEKKSKIKVFTIEYDIDENGRPNSQMTINNVQWKFSKKSEKFPKWLESFWTV